VKLREAEIAAGAATKCSPSGGPMRRDVSNPSEQQRIVAADLAPVVR
jgi:hypothetical protein